MSSNHDELESLVDLYSSNRNFYVNKSNNYNELSCRNEFINPLLSLLGWDVSNKLGKKPQYREVIVENSINSTDRPDYSLTLNGVLKVFVEVKKPSINIEFDIAPAFQIKRYGWNAKHKIGVLTNFEYLIIYDTTKIPNESDNVNVARFHTYHYSEYVLHFNEIYEILSKESMYNGKFDKLMNSTFINMTRDTITIDDYFLSQINQWRINIGKYLFNNVTKYSNFDLINDVTQEFINQIIFLRICEDNRLPLYHSLFDSTINESDVKNKLHNLLIEADKLYNSGLFRNNSVIFDLGEDLILNIIKDLYYPRSPYLFNIIEPHILGRIYEIFLTKRLVLENNEVILSSKQEYKDKSIITTPHEIVKYMVSTSLNRLCYNKNPKEILNLRIVDIACGSGIFLESCFDFLVQYCVNWYLENSPSYLVELNNGMKKLPFLDKRDLLLNCIYGVDIDYYAVEVAKFSLLIKLIEEETEPSVYEAKPILPDLVMNIKVGNSLISNIDLDSNISIDSKLKIVPFDWVEINKGAKFDLVIGNPPYISTEGMKKLASEVEFLVYKTKYKSSEKQFDKYFLFIEKGISLLKKDGLLTYIVPNKLSKIKSARSLRELISKKKYLLEFNDFGSLQLFEDKSVYSSIIILRNTINNNFTYASIKTATALWSNEPIDRVEFSCEYISDEPWRLTTNTQLNNLLSSIEKKGKLMNEFVDFLNGIQTSAEKPPAYWFSSDEIVEENNSIIKIKRLGKYFEIEKNILKLYFKPTKPKEKNNSSFDIVSTNKYIIFPYDINGILIPIDIMKLQYPGAYSFLEGSYNQLVPKQVLNSGKRDVPNATNETWYQYGRTQHLTTFTSKEKLIVGILSKNPMYIYDNQNMLISAGGTAGYCAVVLKDNSSYSIQFIQAWLNHPITESILRLLGSDFENDYVSRGTYQLNRLFIAALDLNNANDKSYHDDITEYVLKIYDINIRASKANKLDSLILLKEKNTFIDKVNSIIGVIYSKIM